MQPSAVFVSSERGPILSDGTRHIEAHTTVAAVEPNPTMSRAAGLGWGAQTLLATLCSRVFDLSVAPSVLVITRCGHNVYFNIIYFHITPIYLLFNILNYKLLVATFNTNGINDSCAPDLRRVVVKIAQGAKKEGNQLWHPNQPRRKQ